MLRREVVKMAGSLFGLGAGTPSRFPYPDRPQPSPGVSPSSGAVFRGRLVIVFGPAGSVEGVFVYTPGTTPGPGNTPIAALSASATDPYGNSIRPGDASSLGTIIAIGTAPSGGTPSYVQLAPGNPASILISSGDSAEATAGHIDSLISGGGAARNLNLRLTSPKVTGHSTALSQMLLASEAADGSQGPLCLIVATDGVNSADFEVTPTGTVVLVGPFTSTAGTVSNPTLVTTDTWHVVGTPGEPAFLNGWANAGGGLASLQFTLTPQKEIHVIGALNPAGLTATQVCTVPAAYRPGIGQDFGLGFHTAAGAGAGIFGRLTTAGALSMINAGAGSGVICVNVKIPLAPTT